MLPFAALAPRRCYRNAAQRADLQGGGDAPPARGVSRWLRRKPLSPF
jgi:hypothetical protein